MRRRYRMPLVATRDEPSKDRYTFVLGSQPGVFVDPAGRNCEAMAASVEG